MSIYSFIVATEYGIHLGHPVGPKGAPKAILEGINKFVMYFNVIISLFPKAHVNVKYMHYLRPYIVYHVMGVYCGALV